MQYHLQTKLLTALKKSPRKTYKKPASWPDIRKNAENGHIYLLVDERYPIGFILKATGGYCVKIDGVAYDNYESNALFSMADWSEYTATAGYDIDYPTGANKAHIIDIFAQSESEEITSFHCARVAASGQEVQGLLWEHFNLTNAIEITALNATGSLGSSSYYNPALVACTAKNNILNFTYSDNDVKCVFLKCENLEYIPVLNCTTNAWTDASFMFANCQKLEKIVIKNMKIGGANYCFHNCRKLKEVPKIIYSSVQQLDRYVTNAKELKDTTLNLSSANNLKVIGCFGTATNFISGFKGLRVSASAPFNYSNTPQINVSYTGMDRTALVQLFNDLPSVSGSQVINITGCTGTADLSEEDKAIATNKGWTIILAN